MSALTVSDARDGLAEAIKPARTGQSLYATPEDIELLCSFDANYDALIDAIPDFPVYEANQ